MLIIFLQVLQTPRTRIQSLPLPLPTHTAGARGEGRRDSGYALSWIFSLRNYRRGHFLLSKYLRSSYHPGSFILLRPTYYLLSVLFLACRLSSTPLGPTSSTNLDSPTFYMPIRHLIHILSSSTVAARIYIPLLRPPSPLINVATLRYGDFRVSGMLLCCVGDDLTGMTLPLYFSSPIQIYLLCHTSLISLFFLFLFLYRPFYSFLLVSCILHLRKTNLILILCFSP
ncbi:hypothetical protein DFH07DRAFT_846202 [Mycena maculata]|uniref:Uncharacterized protein n=1 Tax=Mycena maculata TaxID=230809 RepID=A0AAD7I1C2_9AGAR|nr:hypothetical protein DFH07DRAFT_846202 [Mycena maculata]